MEEGILCVSAGAAHSAAVTRSGALYTWGAGQFGRLGHGFARSEATPRLVAALLPMPVQQVACGGQLGVGACVQQISQPVLVETFSGPVRWIHAGMQAFACAVTVSGHLYTWGTNTHGELGHGSNTTEAAPRLLAFFGQERAVARARCGVAHMGCVLEDGKMYVWGEGTSGQLGQGKFNKFPSALPVLIDTLEHEKVVDCACGGAHTLALTASGEVWSWGNNQYGQLGSGDLSDRYLPARVSLPSAVQAVAAGLSHSVCLLVNGGVAAFGDNRRGQAAADPSMERAPRPHVFDAGPHCFWTDVSACQDHSLAVADLPEGLVTYLASLCCAVRYSDMQLECAEGAFLPIHAPLVRTRCPLLLEEAAEMPVPLVRLVLHFVYTDALPASVPTDERTLAQLRQAAEDLRLPRLARLCARLARKPVPMLPATLADDVRRLRVTGAYADINVYARGENTARKAHAFLLGRCAALTSLLLSGGKEVPLDQLSPAAVDALLTYVYGEGVVVLPEPGPLLELTRWAHRDSDKPLAAACERALLRLPVNAQTYGALAAMALSKQAPQLARHLRFVTRHHRAVADSLLKAGSLIYPGTPAELQPSVEEEARAREFVRLWVREAEALEAAAIAEAENPSDTRENRKHVNLRASVTAVVPPSRAVR